MIDWQRVNELREEIGVEDFDEVVDLFLEEVAEVVVRLKAGPDTAALESELHFLKGSALNLGFRALGTICAEGERMAMSGQTVSIDVAKVIGCYDTSVAEFTHQLGCKTAA